LFAIPDAPVEGEVCGDQCTAGLNFLTSRPRRDILDDYRTVLRRIYSPEAFFGRTREAAKALRPVMRSRVIPLYELGRFFKLITGVSLRRPDMRRHTWALFFYVLTHNPRALPAAMRFTALYVHLGPFSKYVVGHIDADINELDRKGYAQPLVLAAAG
jgi:hypothetical protein